LREATFAEIKQIARQQMIAQGPAAISLRAIAAEMGMAAPSLYNYFKNRDELVTALIIDTFNAQADRLEEASLSLPQNDYAGRMLALCLAYREWNLAHPTDFALIVGNPIPGYRTPTEATTPAGRRTLQLFIEVIQSAWLEGRLHLPPEYAELSPELSGQLTDFIQQAGYDLALPVLHLTLSIWAQLLGLLFLETYGHFEPILSNPGELYRNEVLAWLKRLGLSQT